MIYRYYKHLIFFKNNLVVVLNIFFGRFFYAKKEIILNKVSHHLRTSALAI